MISRRQVGFSVGHRKRTTPPQARSGAAAAGGRGTLLLLILSAACVSEDESPESPTEVRAFKARHSMAELELDERLRAKFAAVWAREVGIDPKWQEARGRESLAALPELQAGLTSSQLEAWRDLQRMGWDSELEWDADALTPRRIQPGMTFWGDTAEMAHLDLEARLEAVVRRLFGMTAEDELELVSARHGAVTAPLGGAEMARYTVTYARTHAGRPVFGDRLQVTLSRSELDERAWFGLFVARWRKDVQIVTAGLLTVQDALNAIGFDLARGDRLREEPVLGYFSRGSRAVPAFRIDLVEDDGPVRYLVDAQRGEVLKRAAQLVHNSGQITGPVTRPYEAGPSPRPMPFMTIYEEPLGYLVPSGGWIKNPEDGSTCNYKPILPNGTRVRGDRALASGTTDAAGTYGAVPNLLLTYDPNDTSWVIDFRSPYVVDATPVASAVVDFPASSSLEILGSVESPGHTGDTFNQGLRAETYYMLNYGRSIYAGFGLIGTSSIGFSLVETGYTGCSGQAYLSISSVSPCVEIRCDPRLDEGGANMSSQVKWRRFREVVLHEQIHTVELFDRGDYCSNSTLCGAWSEGMADFGQLVLNKLEHPQNTFRPGLRFPDDYSGGVYARGSVLTAITLDYQLRVGLQGLGDPLRDFGDVDDNTVVVGSCASPDIVASCPSNSLYRHLLGNQAQWYFPRWRTTQELSAAFHKHVTDADAAVPGVQSFPWADETPNRVLNPPTIFGDLPNGGVVTVSEGNAGGGPLRLNSPQDHDTFMFMANQGQSYTVGTAGLAPGVDTVVEVVTINGINSTLVGINDDCSGGPGPDSCLTFTASESGLHRVTVKPFPGTVTGPGGTYSVYVQLPAPGNGDAIPWSPDGELRLDAGALGSATDVDRFAITVPTAQTLLFEACGADGRFQVASTLLDADGNVLKKKRTKRCDGQLKRQRVEAGTYYLEITSGDGGTGPYGLQVGLENANLDADTPATAFAMDVDTFIATQFEGADDEDWFEIDAPEGGLFIVEAFGTSPGLDATLQVYAPSQTMFAQETFAGTPMPDTSGHGLGHWMIEDDESGLRPGDARLVFRAPVAGTYYVRARPAPGTSVGTYQLLVHANGGFVEPHFAPF